MTARDPASGEVKSFPSESDVPRGWQTCNDSSCSVPADVPCESLGQAVCTLNPACRLKTLSCAGGAPGYNPSDPRTGETSPASGPCEYACLPKLPLLCDELGDQGQCTARQDCEWAAEACTGTCSSDGACTSTCSFTCQAKTPSLCRELAETECKNRPDCEWAASCQPALTPDPCGPAECGPALAMPAYLCPDGTTAGPTGQCLRNLAGQCGWEVVKCAPAPQVDCDPAACGKNPYGAGPYTCPDGQSAGGAQCVRTADGVCAWEMVSCPQA